MARPWLRAMGVVVYPLPWLVFVQEAGQSWGLVRVGGWTAFALYLLIGIAELAVVWGQTHGRQVGMAAGFLRGLGWQDKARRRLVPATVAQLAGRHRAAEADRQLVRPQRFGRHRAPGRHALRATTSVAGGHRAV